MTLIAAVFLPGLVALGIWQLDRGAQKRAMEADYLDQLTRLPVNAVSLDERVRFQRVALRGRFDDEIFLIDNQVMGGAVGYWVVQVFTDESGGRYLTNRGFVPAPKRRDQLPRIDKPAGTVRVIGIVWPYTGLVPLWRDDDWSMGWPKRIQRLDVARMAAAVEAAPLEIRLEPGQPGVAAAAPFARLLTDTKHLGYAATWFGLAVVLALGFVAFGVRNARDE